MLQKATNITAAQIHNESDYHTVLISNSSRIAALCARVHEKPDCTSQSEGPKSENMIKMCQITK